MNDKITFTYCATFCNSSFSNFYTKRFIESDMQPMIDANIVLKGCLLFGESFKYRDRLWLWVADSNEHWEYLELTLIKDSKAKQDSDSGDDD